jgi:hypothetical protein
MYYIKRILLTMLFLLVFAAIIAFFKTFPIILLVISFTTVGGGIVYLTYLLADTFFD